MKHLYLWLSIQLMILSTFCQADIIETTSFADIQRYVPDETSGLLVICDIDDTLSRAHDPEGTDQFFETNYRAALDHNFSVQEALDLVLPRYFAAQERTTVFAVDPDAPAFIRKLQKQNIPVLALTARSLPLVQITSNQLLSIGIDLGSHIPFKRVYQFENLPFPALYTNGILAVGNNNKGIVLEIFLQKVGFEPRTIIYVDDKLKHIKTIEEFAQRHGINFFGFHFTRVEHMLADTLPNLTVPAFAF